MRRTNINPFIVAGRITALLVGCAILFVPTALAQGEEGYDLSHTTVAGGGRVTNGQYMLTATIGQACTGALSGDYTIDAGFLLSAPPYLLTMAAYPIDPDNPDVGTITCYRISDPHIEIGGTYIMWYGISDPNATIAMTSYDPGFEYTPVENGYFSTYLDTSHYPGPLPLEVFIAPESVTATLDDGQYHDLDTSIFSHKLTVVERDYSTFWTLAGSYGFGGGVVAYVELGKEGEFTIAYDTDDQLRLQRSSTDVVTFGATASLLEFEGGPCEVVIAGSDLHVSGRRMKESGLMIDYANANTSDKIAVAIYLLSSIVSFAGEDIMLHPWIGDIIDGLVEQLGIDPENYIEYKGLGFGVSTGGHAMLFDGSLGHSYEAVNINAAEITVGVEGEAGCFYQAREYDKDDLDRHTFGAYVEYFAGLDWQILGNDFFDYGEGDSLVAKLEIDDYGAGPAIGRFHRTVESDDTGLLAMDTDDVCFDFGNIRQSDLYSGTVGNVGTPLYVVVDAPKWCSDLQSRFRACDVTVEKTKGTQVNIPIEISVTFIATKVTLAGGISFEQGNQFLDGVTKRIDDREYPIVTYPDSSHPEAMSLSQLVEDIFSDDFIIEILRSILLEFGSIFEQTFEVVKAVGEETYKVAEGSAEIILGVVNETGEVIEEGGNTIIEEGTEVCNNAFYGACDKLSWKSYPDLATFSEGAAESNDVNIVVIAHNRPEEMSPTSKRFLAANGISTSFMKSMNGVGFVVNRVYAVEPYNVGFANKPATLNMRYDDSMVGEMDENEFRIYRWLEDRHVWAPLSGSPDTGANQISTSIWRLGTFAIGYDMNAPQIDFNDVKSEYTGPVSLYVSVRDGESGVDSNSIKMWIDAEEITDFTYDIISHVLFTDINLPNGDHTIVVDADDMAGNPGTGQIDFLVSPPDLTAPTAPSNLTADEVTDTTVSLLWESSEDDVGVAKYNIYRDGELVGSTSGDTAYTDSDLSPSTTYKYHVTASDATDKESDPSNTIDVTTNDPPPPGDLDGDGSVDCNDLIIFTDDWLEKEGVLPADLDESGTVDFLDFADFAQDWAD